MHVDKREPVDETKFAAEKNMLAENISRSKRDSVFEQWLKTERDTAGVNVGHS